MACGHCESIDIVGASRMSRNEHIAHHATFEELQACAASTGCQLCQWVKDFLVERFKQWGIDDAEASKAQIAYKSDGHDLRSDEVSVHFESHFYMSRAAFNTSF